MQKILERTTRWARGANRPTVIRYTSSFGIVQGGMYKELREQSAYELLELDFPGYAIGGLSVGNRRKKCMQCSDHTVPLLPETETGI